MFEWARGPKREQSNQDWIQVSGLPGFASRLLIGGMLPSTGDPRRDAELLKLYYGSLSALG